MFQSHTSRSIVSALVVYLLVLPNLSPAERGPVHLPEGTWRPPSYSEQTNQVPSPTPGSKIVATWLGGLAEGFSDGRLVYKNGKMILEMTLSFGGETTPFRRELIERPPKQSGERRFDLEDYRWSEYLTLTSSGIVRLFGWEGDHDGPVRAVYLAPEAMTIGKKVIIQSCARRRLSRSALEVVRLHRELGTFRYDHEFARFGVNHPAAYRWLQAYNSLRTSTDKIEFLRETGFYLEDLRSLFDKYLWAAIAPGTVQHSDLNSIEFLENTITSGITIAQCAGDE